MGGLPLTMLSGNKLLEIIDNKIKTRINCNSEINTLFNKYDTDKSNILYGYEVANFIELLSKLFNICFKREGSPIRCTGTFLLI